MSESVTHAQLKAFVEGFNRHDLGAIMDFFAEDCVLYMPRGKAHGGAMNEPDDVVGPSWRAPTSAKAKNAVQRTVTALLDELAPERVLTRSEQLRAPVEQHRTPTGCVLQAATAAVSVSWFAGDDPVLGELRVVVWRGIVSRRGSPKRREGATVVSEMALQPIERPSNECAWRATDGSEYDSAALAALCTRLLDEQVRSGE
jgi:hypothetical protein